MSSLFLFKVGSTLLSYDIKCPEAASNGLNSPWLLYLQRDLEATSEMLSS